MLNEHYGPSLPPHTKHDRMQTETSHWLCYFNDNDAEKAIQMAEKSVGLSVAHYDLRFLKPLDEELLHKVGSRFKQVITVEDGVVNGGMGSAVLEFFNNHGYDTRVKMIGIPDMSVEHGTVAELRKLTGMDADSICNAILSLNS